MPCHDAATPRSPTHPGRAQLGAVPPAGTSPALLLVPSALCFPHGSAKPGLGPCRSEPPAGSGRLRAVPRSLRGPSQHRPPLGTGPLLTHSWRSCGRARIPACTSLGSSFSPGCLHLALPVTTAASRRSQPHAEPTPAPHRWADPPRSHQLSLTTPSQSSSPSASPFSPDLSALPQPQRPAAPCSPEGHPCSAAVPSPFQPLLPTPLGPCPPPCSSQSGFTGSCGTEDSLFLLLWGFPHSSLLCWEQPVERNSSARSPPCSQAAPSYLPAPNLPRRASAGRAAKPFLPSDASPGRRDEGCALPHPQPAVSAPPAPRR